MVIRATVPQPGRLLISSPQDWPKVSVSRCRTFSTPRPLWGDSTPPQFVGRAEWVSKPVPLSSTVPQVPDPDRQAAVLQISLEAVDEGVLHNGLEGQLANPAVPD